MESSPGCRYVSRGGHKLAAALDGFDLDPTDVICADLGSNVGGFVDCLLQRGAAKVYAIDTGYGVLAWKLRRDPRVVVMERVNAMHATLPEPVDLVTIDVGWTRQHHIVPAALGLLATGGRIVTLIKPHYEGDRHELRKGVLAPATAQERLGAIQQRITDAGAVVRQIIPSPIAGGKGNVEFLALLSPRSAPPSTR